MPVLKYEPIVEGDRFTNWTVLALAPRDTWRKKHWICECKCGRVKPVADSLLKRGQSKSCGCYRYQFENYAKLISPEKRGREVLRLYKAGYNKTEIARKVGFAEGRSGRRSVSRWLNKSFRFGGKK
jgi:hypothetical protein